MSKDITNKKGENSGLSKPTTAKSCLDHHHPIKIKGVIHRSSNWSYCAPLFHADLCQVQLRHRGKRKNKPPQQAAPIAKDQKGDPIQ